VDRENFPASFCTSLKDEAEDVSLNFQRLIEAWTGIKTNFADIAGLRQMMFP